MKKIIGTLFLLAMIFFQETVFAALPGSGHGRNKGILAVGHPTTSQSNHQSSSNTNRFAAYASPSANTAPPVKMNGHYSVDYVEKVTELVGEIKGNEGLPVKGYLKNYLSKTVTPKDYVNQMLFDDRSALNGDSTNDIYWAEILEYVKYDTKAVNDNKKILAIKKLKMLEGQTHTIKTKAELDQLLNTVK